MIDWILSLIVGIVIGLVFTLVCPVLVSVAVGFLSFIVIRILFLFAKRE